MNKLLFSGPWLLAGVVACADGAAPATFQVAVVVKGQGSVNSTPEGLDCTGPKECNVVPFEGTVSLLLTPAPGVELVGITVDDVEVAAAETIDVTGAAGSTRHVEVTFEDIDLGPGPARDDAGDADAGTQADAASDAL